MWVFRTLALATLVHAGCGNSVGGMDMASDGNFLVGPDQGAPAVCTVIPTWPAADVSATGIDYGYPNVAFTTSIYAKMPDGALLDELGVEVYTPITGAPTYPLTVTLTTSMRYNDCQDCVVLYTGVDPTSQLNTSTFFFGQGGTLIVEQADTTPGGGTIHVKGTNLHFVEWSYFDQSMADMPVADGKCYDVGSFELTQSYVNPDGGAGSDL